MQEKRVRKKSSNVGKADFELYLLLARHFITRALLSSENFVQAQQILRDTGVGAADGCSINMTFLRQVDYKFIIKDRKFKKA